MELNIAEERGTLEEIKELGDEERVSCSRVMVEPEYLEVR